MQLFRVFMLPHSLMHVRLKLGFWFCRLLYNSLLSLITVVISPGSILDISKYRDTCERSISILHGIAILRYIEVSNDQTILGRYSYDPEYRRSILRYFRTDTAAEQ